MFQKMPKMPYMLFLSKPEYVIKKVQDTEKGYTKPLKRKS